MNEVNIFGIYVAPVSVLALWALIIFLVLRAWFDRLQIQRWVWHRPLFDTAVFVIVLSLLGLIF